MTLEPFAGLAYHGLGDRHFAAVAVDDGAAMENIGVTALLFNMIQWHG